MSVYRYRGLTEVRQEWTVDEEGKAVLADYNVPLQWLAGVPARDLTEEDVAGLDADAQTVLAQNLASEHPLYSVVGTARGVSPLEAGTRKTRKTDEPTPTTTGDEAQAEGE